MKLWVVLVVLSGCAAAQERARFQLFSQLVDLPETSNSIPAVIEGEQLEITDKWSIRNENLLASNAQGYFFGFSYNWDIRHLLEHTSWSHEELSAYLTGSLGRVYSERNLVNRTGIGFFAGGGLSYLPKHSERLEIQLFELRLARLPNVHGGLCAVVSTGIQLGF